MRAHRTKLEVRDGHQAADLTRDGDQLAQRLCRGDSVPGQELVGPGIGHTLRRALQVGVSQVESGGLQKLVTAARSRSRSGRLT